VKDRVKAKVNPKALHQVQVKIKAHHKVKVKEKVQEKAKVKVKGMVHLKDNLLVQDKIKAPLWTVVNLEIQPVRDRAKEKEVEKILELGMEEENPLVLERDNLRHLINQVQPLEAQMIVMKHY
jgi:hypothetical protein